MDPKLFWRSSDCGQRSKAAQTVPQMNRWAARRRKQRCWSRMWTRHYQEAVKRNSEGMDTWKLHQHIQKKTTVCLPACRLPTFLPAPTAFCLRWCIPVYFRAGMCSRFQPDWKGKGREVDSVRGGGHPARPHLLMSHQLAAAWNMNRRRKWNDSKHILGGFLAVKGILSGREHITEQGNSFG